MGNTHCLDVASGCFCVKRGGSLPSPGHWGSGPGAATPPQDVAHVQFRSRIAWKLVPGAPHQPRGPVPRGRRALAGGSLSCVHSHTGMVAHSNTGAGVASKPRHPATQQPSQTPKAHFHNRLTPHTVSPEGKPPPPRAHVFAVCGPHRAPMVPPAPVVSARLRCLRAGGRRRERTHPRCATRGGVQASLWE